MPWRPTGLWDVEAHRCGWGCQPYAPAGRPLPPGRFLVLISVRGRVDHMAIVRLANLANWKIQWPHREWNPRPFSLWHSASTNYATACPYPTSSPVILIYRAVSSSDYTAPNNRKTLWPNLKFHGLFLVGMKRQERHQAWTVGSLAEYWTQYVPNESEKRYRLRQSDWSVCLQHICSYLHAFSYDPNRMKNWSRMLQVFSRTCVFWLTLFQLTAVSITSGDFYFIWKLIKLVN
jgi:hypothetical protein